MINKKLILITSFCLCITFSINTHAQYKCTNSAGQVSFQDRACETDSEQIELSGPKTGAYPSPADKRELILSLGKMLGKKLDPNDPKMLQMAEAMFAVDAAKAYAFTRIHGVSLEFCPDNKNLVDAMNNFKLKAEWHIKLGEIYYREGVDLQIGEKRFKHSGYELTKGLEGMLVELRNKHRKNPERNCREAVKALNLLAKFYASGP